MGAKFLSVRESSFNMEKEERATKFCVVGLELHVSVWTHDFIKLAS